MSFKSLVLAAAASVTLAGAALAEDMAKIMVNDAYARAATKTSKTGGAFMAIMNHSGEDDRLIGVRSPAAKKTELHTHIENGDGVMQMVHVEEGFAIPAGETHMLQRGGDHVMLMGLTAPLAEGDSVKITLIFEKAGEIEVDVPVDLTRKAAHGGMKHNN
jgi:copper(I)-binding protein